jgi:hypothetical protein
MILGFVAIGVVLGYWTVKHSISMPVHESNEFMMKYQNADLSANEIIKAQNLFNQKYTLTLLDFKPSDFKPEHLKRKAGKIMALESKNKIAYKIMTKDGKIVNDANVSLLVTRPHTDKDDQLFTNIKGQNGIYKVSDIELKNAGRYILRLRAQIGEAVAYNDTEAYFSPKK